MTDAAFQATTRPLTVLRAVATPTAAGPVVLSAPEPVDLVIYRGDSGRFRVTVTDPAGAPLDVSGATWESQMRPNQDSTTQQTFTVTPVVGDPSSVDVILDAATSAAIDFTAGVWDLQMTMTGEVQTLLGGRVTVTKDVSRP